MISFDALKSKTKGYLHLKSYEFKEFQERRKLVKLDILLQQRAYRHIARSCLKRLICTKGAYDHAKTQEIDSYASLKSQFGQLSGEGGARVRP